MSAGFNEARCALLAKREGISFREAASRMASNGARRRRIRKAQRVNNAIKAHQRQPWWLQESLR